MNNKDVPMTITPTWAGECKNGKYKICDEALSKDPKKQWFSRGKNLDPNIMFEKGKTYEVMVGTDQYGNQYINGLDGGPQPGFDEAGNPLPAVSETPKPAEKAPQPVRENISVSSVRTAMAILTEFLHGHGV